METVIGIDVGTQGVRVLVVNKYGILVDESHVAFSFPKDNLLEGQHEQDPDVWWKKTVDCLRKITSHLTPKTQIFGITVVSTSGTILPLDEYNRPLHNALMYNDNRSHKFVEEVKEAGHDLELKMGYGFDSSFALPKILWFLRKYPHLNNKTTRFIHPVDYIVGNLTGEFKYTDSSNALKTGYDAIDNCWPKFIENKLNIQLSKLPIVVPPGTLISKTSKLSSEITALPEGIPVYAGVTDGTASHISSGATSLGTWNSSLGTTLVVKGLSEKLLIDPLHRIYSQIHPSGKWLPGGASNTGTEWITNIYKTNNIVELDNKANELLPTNLFYYPLARKGERFPFRRKNAESFIIGNNNNMIELFAAGLEGTAYIERLAYETISNLGGCVKSKIYVTGGGANSDIWLKIRASVLGKTLIKPNISEAAMGAALIAASNTFYDSLDNAADEMVTVNMAIDPDDHLKDLYEEKYRQFLHELYLKDYISLQNGTAEVNV